MSETPKHSAEQGYNWSQTESGLYVPESKWGEKPASEQIATNPETIDDRPSPSVEMRATIDDLSAQLDELNSDNRLLGSGEAREKREKIAHLEEDLGNLNTLWTQLGGESVDSTLSTFRQRETEVKNYREANPGEKVPEAIDRMVSDASDAYRAQKTRFDQEYRTWEAAQKQISDERPVVRETTANEVASDVVAATSSEVPAEKPKSTVTPEASGSTTPTSPEASVPENIESPESVESAEYGLDNAMCAAIAGDLFGGKMSVDRIADIIRSNSPELTPLQTSYAVLDVLYRGLDYMAENPAEFGGQKLNLGTFEVKSPEAKPITPAVAEAIAVTQGIIDQDNPYKNPSPAGEASAETQSSEDPKLVRLREVTTSGRPESMRGVENEKDTRRERFKKGLAKAGLVFAGVLLAVGAATGLVSGPGVTQTAVADTGPKTVQTDARFGEFRADQEKQTRVENAEAVRAAEEAERQRVESLRMDRETAKQTIDRFAGKWHNEASLAAGFNGDVRTEQGMKDFRDYVRAHVNTDSKIAAQIHHIMNGGEVNDIKGMNAILDAMNESDEKRQEVVDQVSEFIANADVVNIQEIGKNGVRYDSTYNRAGRLGVASSGYDALGVSFVYQNGHLVQLSDGCVQAVGESKAPEQAQRAVPKKAEHVSAKSKDKKATVIKTAFTVEEIQKAPAPVKKVVGKVIKETETPPEVVTPDIPDEPVTPDIPDKPAVPDTPVIPDSPVKENPPVETIDDKDPTESIEVNRNLNEDARSTVKDNEVGTNIGNEPDEQAVIAPDNGKAPAPAAKPVTVESTNPGTVVEQSTEDRDTAIAEAAPAGSSGETGDGAPLQSGQVD